MKKISILLIFILLFTNFSIITNASQNTQLDYTETLETFDNPERGFYTYLYYDFQVEGNEEPKPYLLEGNLIHLRLGIGNFSGKVNKNQDLELSSDMLNMLDNILKKIKLNGATAIVRFAYDNFDGDEDVEPSLDMILKHIKQICPILAENKDVISYVELGFFGPWGEMHSSEICTPENVSQALTLMLENTPEEIKIGVRQPKYYVNWLGIDRAKLNENITVKGTPEYRVGLFNDGYLGSHSDLGTFENREIEIQWLEKQALHTLYGGEVVSTRTSSGNEEIDKINTSQYMSQEAFRTHTTYLNFDYDKKVINSWKEEIYNGTDELYKGQSGYLYISNHLGYRFVLRNSTINTVENKKININLDIENVGFANLVNDKKVTVILENENKKYEIPTNIDPTTWNSTKITNINTEIQLTEDFEEGKWTIYLRISKYGDYSTDNNYQCIRLANNNVWNENIGANYIGNLLYKNSENNENENKPSTGVDDNKDNENQNDPSTGVDDNKDNENQNNPSTDVDDNKDNDNQNNPSTDVDDNKGNENQNDPSTDVDDNEGDENQNDPSTNVDDNKGNENPNNPFTDVNNNNDFSNSNNSSNLTFNKQNESYKNNYTKNSENLNLNDTTINQDKLPYTGTNLNLFIYIITIFTVISFIFTIYLYKKEFKNIK